MLVFRFNPKREDDINDESFEQQSYNQPQKFQSHDIPEVIIEQVEEEEQEGVNEDVTEESTQDTTNEVNNAVGDKQNELLKQLESLKIQFQKVVQERNQEV